VGDRSTALLARLGQLNRTALFLTTVVVVLGALLLPGRVGAVFLLGTALALAALLTVTWPRHTAQNRALRLAVLALLLVLALLRLW
jgi:Family of unknown function (DUF6703)